MKFPALFVISGAVMATGCGGEAIIDGARSDDATSGTTRVRLAHLSPDAPSVDLCVDAGDGVEPFVVSRASVSYAEVSNYGAIDRGRDGVSFRLVAAGAGCGEGLLPDLVVGTFVDATSDIDVTIAAVGMVAPMGTDQPLSLELYPDDNTPPAAGTARLRFIHASPDTPAVDVGTGTVADGTFAEVWDGVMFPDVGLLAGDAYLSTPPLEGATVSARADDAPTDALVIPGVDLQEGQVATAFAVGNLDGDPQPLQVLLCVDNAAGGCARVP
ncbi:MAG: DUF4397 domain-containing protein [Myxococcota bacterium]